MQMAPVVPGAGTGAGTASLAGSMAGTVAPQAGMGVAGGGVAGTTAGTTGPSAGMAAVVDAGSQPTMVDAAVPDSGSGDAGTGPTVPVVSECIGMPLPERAVRGAFDKREPPAGLEMYWPTAGFRSAEPAQVGLDAELLDQVIDLSTPGTNTQAVLIIRHGYLALEHYAAGFSASSRFESFSMAKSFSSTLIGILIDRGDLGGVDEPLCQFYDEWSCDASDPHSAITVDHAMNVTTGLQWQEDWRESPMQGNDAVFASITGMLNTTLGRAVVDEPGTRMRYSTGDPSLLTGVIQGATGQTALEFARQALFSKIGTPDIRWGSDSRGRTTTYAGMQATAIEYAKFGYLFLREGQWDGEQVVSKEWVERVSQADDPCVDWYRYLWHVNPPIRLGEGDPSCPEMGTCPPLDLADIPPDTFFAEGINGQFMFVIPSADMIAVRLGSDGGGVETWDAAAREFLGKVLGAVL